MFPSYKPFQGFRGPIHPLSHRFLVIISNIFPFYKPFQGLRGPTQRIFVTFNDEVDGPTHEDGPTQRILCHFQ